MTRRFSVVVFGASGFTGRLVAEYLMRGYGRDLAWAIAGRNRAKLEHLARELAQANPGALPVEVLVADSTDRDALRAMATQSRVVCTTVGPYAEHGELLVQLCAETGTHYCDLTGEVPFIRRCIDRHHARAVAQRARIIHCAGFDSIPSDLGVFMLHEHFRAQGKRLGSAAAFFGPMHGAMSGGTLASMLQFMQQVSSSRELRELAFDPYSLVPDRQKDRGPDGLDRVGVHYDRELGQWTGFFEMAAINTRVVRRTNALLDHAYGRDFRYREARCFGSGAKGLASASAMTAALSAFGAVSFVAAGRGLLARLGPKPGEGPSQVSRAAARYEIRILGEADGSRAVAFVAGGDPGYGDTAKMIAECALCLALDAERLPARFGMLTPAAAMGSRLLERLRAAGVVFELAADLASLALLFSQQQRRAPAASSARESERSA